jgi:hypothetical protein
MNRPRLYRWLRIAVSAVCLVTCCMLVGLWVRSYTWLDSLQVMFIGNRTFHVQSFEGQIAALVVGKGVDIGNFELRTGSAPGSYIRAARSRGEYDSTYFKKLAIIGFTIGPDKAIKNYNMTSTIAILSHRLLLLMFAALAFIPWLPWCSLRFSLRTLLIVTTLVAFVLGLGVWLARR